MSDYAIKLEGVSKNYRLPHEKATTIKSLFTGLLHGNPFRRDIETLHALTDISLEIKPGEFFGIVGRNGSGKSTLLKIIAGIYQPTKGKVHVSGKLVPFIELGVGFNPELTGKENVYLNGALLGFSRQEVDEFYDEVVEFAELEKFMDQKLKNYSSGMQVRLAFSMAIRANADILLIDEVLAVGDADFQRKCYEYFQQVKSEGMTMVFVTHDMGAVRQYCDRVALLEASKIINISDAETAAKKYMQLFAEDKHKLDQHVRKTKRWGNKKAFYSHVKTELVDEKEIVVSMMVGAKEDILDPTYGFKISNEANQPILGTNTNIVQARIKPLKAGQRSTLRWKFPNIFNEGKYYVEVVIMYKSVTEVADWWENATSFRVANETRTPYIVNPQTEFSIE